MHIIGIETEGLGTNNQMRGVILEGIKFENKGNFIPVSREELLKNSDGRLLHTKNFANQQDFENAIQSTVDIYVSSNKKPDYVILPCDHSHIDTENKDVDNLSLALKKAFKKHGHSIKTMVMASNLYDYKNVDLIHVGKHLLSEKDEQNLRTNPELKKRVVETLGVPSNISWLSIKNLANQPNIKKVLSKYRNSKKNVLFSLGGITDNGAIGFDVHDADKLIKSAIKLKSKGYNVIFTNSPRTPSEVTDVLYEKCQAFHMDFFNSKKVAKTDGECNNFRNYNGKYKEQFEKQASEIGNIYPAILDVCEFVVNTHDSFSYTSDAAALGIPSVVYNENFIDRSQRQDCYNLFELCEKDGYVISLEKALNKIDNKESIKTKKMDSVSIQLVKSMKKSLSNMKMQFNTAEK